MNCEEVRERLIDYVAGELEESTRTDLEAHLKTCPDCVKEERSTKRFLAIAATAQDEPVVKLVDEIVTEGVTSRASDIHLQAEADWVLVRYRVDGVLREARRLEKPLWHALRARLAVLADCNVAERRRPQDGRILMKCAGRELDLRVSMVPTATDGKVVIRILDRGSVLIGLDRLDVSFEALAAVRQLLSLPNGLVVVTGPTGCGKTTTLYSLLQELNDSGRCLCTVEDPVEYLLPQVAQVPVNPKEGLTFASAIRSLMRQDPDVIMVGEIRDRDTAELCAQATLTGHLVMTSLHTGDAPSVPRRLIDIGVEPFIVRASLVGVIAQRLARRVCPACRTDAEVPAGIVKTLTELGCDPSDLRAQRGAGCPECHQSGYRGRLALFEVMTMSEELGEIVMEGGNADELRSAARKQGMRTLLEDGIEKVRQGLTTVEEVYRVAAMGYV